MCPGGLVAAPPTPLGGLIGVRGSCGGVGGFPSPPKIAELLLATPLDCLLMELITPTGIGLLHRCGGSAGSFNSEATGGGSQSHTPAVFMSVWHPHKSDPRANVAPITAYRLMGISLPRETQSVKIDRRQRTHGFNDLHGMSEISQKDEKQWMQ